MSSTRINAALNALREIDSQVIASQQILLLELESAGWKRDTKFTGGYCLPARSLYMMDKELIAKVTNDSTDANYIHLCTHLMRNGWNIVDSQCRVQHPENCAGPMPVREALLACINVGSGS